MEDESPLKMGFEGRAAAAQVAVGDDLWELHAAGSRVVGFTAGRQLAEYAASEALQAAVRVMLELMGSALGRLEKTAPELAARLDGPDLLELCAQMQEAKARDEEVWGFVQAALPELLARTETELTAWHEG